jgi:hypothetical protein
MYKWTTRVSFPAWFLRVITASVSRLCSSRRSSFVLRFFPFVRLDLTSRRIRNRPVRWNAPLFCFPFPVLIFKAMSLPLIISALRNRLLNMVADKKRVRRKSDCGIQGGRLHFWLHLRQRNSGRPSKRRTPSLRLLAMGIQRLKLYRKFVHGQSY